jgi:hypothetical protein
MKNSQVVNNELDAKKIIIKAGYDEPSNDFASHIMDIISSNPLPVKVNVLPIFSPMFLKFASIAVLVVLGTITLLTLFIPTGKSVKSQTTIGTITEQVNTAIEGLIKSTQLEHLMNVLTYIPVILFAAFLLILIDNLFRKNKRVGLN